MKIYISKYNDRFYFDIINNKRILFSSYNQFYFVPFLKSSYKYAWEAYKDGRKLIAYYPHHIITSMEDMTKNVAVNVSAEEKILDHYEKIINYIKQKIRGAIGNDKDMDNIYTEIKIIKAELQILIEKIKKEEDVKQLRKLLRRLEIWLKKYFTKQLAEDKEKSLEQNSLQPLSFSNTRLIKLDSLIYMSKKIDNLDGQVKEEILEHYAHMVCCVLQEYHPNIIYKLSKPDFKEIIFIIIDKKNKPILRININDNMLVNAIQPLKDLAEIYPYHSVEFYQKYWKPIVEKIGHYYSEDLCTVILGDNLPDISKHNKNFEIDGWDIINSNKNKLNISFIGNPPTWLLNVTNTNNTSDATKRQKTASDTFNTSSDYTEQDYFNAIVRCTDKTLKSIYGRTGEVIQIIPRADFLEMDVDFGRGLGIIRLTNNQLEIVKID